MQEDNLIFIKSQLNNTEPNLTHVHLGPNRFLATEAELNWFLNLASMTSSLNSNWVGFGFLLDFPTL